MATTGSSPEQTESLSWHTVTCLTVGGGLSFSGGVTARRISTGGCVVVASTGLPVRPPAPTPSPAGWQNPTFEKQGMQDYALVMITLCIRTVWWYILVAGGHFQNGPITHFAWVLCISVSVYMCAYLFYHYWRLSKAPNWQVSAARA